MKQLDLTPDQYKGVFGVHKGASCAIEATGIISNGSFSEMLLC